MSEQKKTAFGIVADRIEQAIAMDDVDKTLRWIEVAERLSRPCASDGGDIAFLFSIGTDRSGTVVDISDSTIVSGDTEALLVDLSDRAPKFGGAR